MTAGQFARYQRLTQAIQFKRVFANACKKADQHFTLLFRTNEEKQARLGMVVAKRHIKHAVKRNRVKRLIRECFRQHTIKQKPVDIVILLRRDVTGLNNQKIRASLNKLFDDI